MRNRERGITLSMVIGMFFLLALTFIILHAIFGLNGGLLTYTLDDPYIHLALSQNIIQGHYGINLSEYSAPASSILWPFVIAPFSASIYSPFLINLLAAICSVMIFVQILKLTKGGLTESAGKVLLPVFTVLFILTTNMIGLIFTGMEHSIQLFVVLLIAYGLMVEAEKNEITWWFVVAIILAPLIRYECMAVSFASILYLVLRRRPKPAVLTALVLISCLGGFSLFLMSMGLDGFPSSVNAKSSVVRTGGTLGSMASNVINSLTHRQGMTLCFGMILLAFYVFWLGDLKRKLLAASTISAVTLHVFFGQYGWYYRYEIYILAFELCIILYLYFPLVNKRIFSSETGALNSFCTIVFALGVTLVIAAPYIYSLSTIPNATNNIYEQQYQMHRFAVEFYKKPIAVNDLGYVAYDNDNFVLDLWGLGSQKALKARFSATKSDWKQEVIDEANVKLVMIYDEWFNDRPEDWIKVGELHLGREKITPAHSNVAFYATDTIAYQEILAKVTLFSKTLPDDVQFKFSQKSL